MRSRTPWHTARWQNAETAINAFSMNEPLGRALVGRGFMPGASPMQFCVRARVPRNDVLADRGRWHVVFGDSDMDR